MMKMARTWLLGFFLVLAGRFGCAQSVPVISSADLQRMLSQPDDSVLVVNFWATWCGPCVTELPYFDQLSAQYTARKVKVVLVNLDGAPQLEKKVRPFLSRRPLTSARVLLLDTKNDDSWIGQLDASWSGALPFTVMINPRRNQRKTFERSFTRAELEAEIKSISQ